MRKFITALILGGILMGAVYGAAATLVVTSVDQIGSVSTAVNTPDAVLDIAYGLLPADNSIAANIQLNFNTLGNITDTVDLQILSGGCGGTLQFTISTTGAANTRTINLDTNGGGSGIGPGSTGLSVSLIECVLLTVTEENP